MDTRPIEYPPKPFARKIPKSRCLQQLYARKREKEKSSALQERIEVDIADLENRRRQIVRSVQEKVRESYSFLPDERRSAKKMRSSSLPQWKSVFTFDDQLTLHSTISRSARLPQGQYNRCWVLGSTSAPPLSAPRPILTKACSALREISK